MSIDRLSKKPYAGFSSRELEVLLDLVKDDDLRIADPMSGASGMLCGLAKQGRHLHLSDSNPVAVLLTSLRHPFFKLIEGDINRDLLASVELATAGLSASGSTRFVADVVSDDVADLLRDFAARIESTPIVASSGEAGRTIMFAIAILSAREISNYRLTKNETWPRFGNVAPAFDLEQEFARTARAFAEWLRNQSSPTSDVSWSDITFDAADVRELGTRVSRLDLILTSPPYANRVDYPRYWAPELAVWDAMHSTSSAAVLPLTAVGPSHVGNINKDEGSRFSDLYESQVEAIRSRSGYKSPEHYAQLAEAYSERLAIAVEQMIKSLSASGRLALALRNTKFGDYVYDPSEIVDGVAQSCGRRARIVDRHVIRHHVGNRARARSKSTVVGLAQSAYVVVVEEDRLSGGAK